VGSACIEGVCAKPCDPGEFACPGGEQCVNGYCLPTSCDLVVCPEGLTCFNGVCLADGGMSTSSSSSGSTTTTTTTSGAGGAGGSMTGAGGAGGISTTTSTTATASSSSGGIFGLATGGGGCKCSLPGAADDAPARGGLALAAISLATLLRRRRDARRAGSISKGDAR
jgi:MYXO-CTERM domain-containing protein